MPVEGHRSDRLRIAALLLERRETLLLDLVELGGGKCRLAQDLRNESEHRRQLLPDGFDRGRDGGGRAADLNPRFQAIQLVLDLLPRTRQRSAHQQRRSNLGRGCSTHQTPLVAKSGT